MAHAPPLGAAVNGARLRVSVISAFVVFVLFVPYTDTASAQQRYALVVSGATGGQEYAAQYLAWTDALDRIFTTRFKLEPAHVTVLSEADNPATASTADNVRKSVAKIQQ